MKELNVRVVTVLNVLINVRKINFTVKCIQSKNIFASNSRFFFYQHLPPYLITEHVLLNTFVMLQGYFVLLLLLTLFIYCFRDCSQILLLMLNEFEQTISIYAP